jgi:hypothetical protein
MMQTEAAQAAWEKRLNYLSQAAGDWHNNCLATLATYDGNREAYAADMIEEFKTGYTLNEAEERFVTARFRELVGIEEE